MKTTSSALGEWLRVNETASTPSSLREAFRAISREVDEVARLACQYRPRSRWNCRWCRSVCRTPDDMAETSPACRCWASAQLGEAHMTPQCVPLRPQKTGEKSRGLRRYPTTPAPFIKYQRVRPESAIGWSRREITPSPGGSNQARGSQRSAHCVYRSVLRRLGVKRLYRTPVCPDNIAVSGPFSGCDK